MDRISNLSDDLLLKIVSSLPTKDVVSTMILLKRWRFLWTMVSKLYFCDSFVLDHSTYIRFRNYVDRSMLLRRGPVLETLKFDVGPCCNTIDMSRWILTGIVQDVRELEIIHFEEEYFEEHRPRPIRLQKTLYTYEKLEVLKLSYSILLDVPVDVCFPSLKTLHLICVEYKTRDSPMCRLLSGCPVLEDLYLSFVDYYGDLCLSENMPKVVEANVKVEFVYKNPEKLLWSLPSVKRLYLCLSASMLQHHIGFYHLVHLELYPSLQEWWNLLTWMLESSPKLQVLKNCEKRRGGEEKKIVAYILKNARQLKIAGISVFKYVSKAKRSEKRNELVSLPRASSSYQLLLD
ncbi:hypothetical protein EUTSA_v10027344mg [Eutrema salsugineum]|uniref:FBD domain-containing protein n=1 Tax=Eutrema salsugineum TaxID=72664 RepID=V4P930_EUTSA|nr:hypothetical protein EUTSA_v10027344mg [Eutrema salsugineum]